MGNENESYTSLSQRLAQSQQDRASNMALGNWSIGTTTTANTNPFGSQYQTITNDSIRYAMDAMMLNVSPMYGSYGSSGKSEEQKNKVGVKVLNKIKAAAKEMTVTEKDGELAISKADEYRALGLESMARIVEVKSNRILREMGISAAGYKRINRSELDKFQKELEEISDMTSKRRLLETPLNRYVGQNTERVEGQAVMEVELGVPPQDVLDKLKIARDAKLFDDFAVLHIQRVPDPILCGKINESNDLYFIAEWGDDVKLSDIVKE